MSSARGPACHILPGRWVQEPPGTLTQTNHRGGTYTEELPGTLTEGRGSS